MVPLDSESLPYAHLEEDGRAEGALGVEEVVYDIVVVLVG
jgi:hypothetical protein